MFLQLQRAWNEKLSALRSEPDVEDHLLEALGMVLVRTLFEDPRQIAPGDTRLLRARGKLLVARGRLEDDDDGQVLGLARAAVALLDAPGADSHSVPNDVGDLLPPPPGRLLRMLRGEPDGISAGLCAAAVHRSAESQRALQTLLLAEPIELRAAAQSPGSMRDPAEGTQLAAWADPAFEVVLFAEAAGEVELGVYAATEAPVRLTASGARTTEMLPGYWFGSLPTSGDDLRVTIEVGDSALEVSLPNGATAPTE
ncbi:MAG: hypothetical protein AAGF12_04500 [Myxococcota bacterium]